MAKDATLKAALGRLKGVDIKRQHQKTLQKNAEKRKKRERRSQVDIGALEEIIAGKEEDEEAEKLAEDPEFGREDASANGVELEETVNGQADGWESDGSEDAEDDVQGGGLEILAFEDESDSDSEDEGIGQNAEDQDDEEDIPLSDIESLASEERGDIIPHQRLTINNTAALQRSLRSVALPTGLPFSATQSVTSAEAVQIPDLDDDLNRELAFYKQSLDAVKEARIQLKKEGVPFSRPADYFAEMVKSEEQMGKVRQKMVDEAARKKASADARRQRDLKKFGKAVQVAKLQERDRAKRDTLDKINTLKRKRQGAELGATEDDLFDVALEDAAVTAKTDRAARRGKTDTAGLNRKRQNKDEKFGFGGKKRFAKSNDARSTGDMKGFSTKRMKGKPVKQRPGKSRRAKMP